MLWLLVFGAGLWAGVQNALAGGGSFVTLPALILAGLTPLEANITSTLALFPAQVSSGWAGRSLLQGAGGLSVKRLVAVSLVGGAVGAWLLLHTPSDVFASLVPWLVLFATAVFAWGSFGRRSGPGTAHLNPAVATAVQALIGVYGGYFGGGIGFLMLAVLTMAGLNTRHAAATKNVLAGVMNAAAVLTFVTAPQVHWLHTGVLAAGAVLGGVVGARALHHVNERVLRGAVVVLGLLLTTGLFLRPI